MCELYSNIVRDVRHTHVRLLSYGEILERTFGAWTMAQVQAPKIDPRLLLKYFKSARLDPFDSPAHATWALLQELEKFLAQSPNG